ncbi:MAG: hypothetical protein DRQ62_14525 [Gammaproteobacteria bacterium]|nr:MAG: hypothetical protein DRQ62_14525 [Gammaproteobacteria bacterium]
MLLSLLIAPILSWASNNPIVELKTSRGLITVELMADKAPKTVNNFLSYVHEGFYENTLFHRVISDFMIQGGGYNINLEMQEARAPIALEANVGLSNLRGTIAMARLHDPDTARSQFFINTADNSFLDYQNLLNPGYAVFAQVIDGMDVVDAISALATGTVSSAAGILRDVPEDPARIEYIRLREGQLSFTEMQATYTSGDIIKVAVQETMKRQSILDLWVAVMGNDGSLIYVTKEGFSNTPVAFKAQVPVHETRHPVFSFTVPQGLTGQYTLLAIFNKSGAGLDDLMHSLRSNIAQASISLL